MANRAPLVIINGRPRALPTADFIDPAGIAPFTATVPGLVPATGIATTASNTANFLRSDGKFALPLAPIFTATTAGDVPASGGGTVNFLRADGTFAAPTAAAPATFTATTAGSVPASGGGTVNFLRADGTFAVMALEPVFTATTVGNVPASGGGTVNFLRADGTFTAMALEPVFTATTVGNVPASGGGTANFLRADGTFTAPTIPNFTATVAGAVPASGGGTVNFLRADGTFATPAPDSRFFTALLAADVSNSTVTLAKITGLDEPLPIGTYQFIYYIRYSAAAITTGVRFSVNCTATTTFFIANMRWVDAGSSASTTNVAPSQANVAAAGGIVGAFSARVKSTLGWGTTASVDVANGDMLMIIEGSMQISTAGNLELWHGSEVAAATTVRAGSSVITTRVI